jgi:hypothetical protein
VPADREKLLKKIRANYRSAKEYWRETREERATDMRYACGDPWTHKDRTDREAAGRPVLNHDELNQYINQQVNDLRMNKRGIKVEPSDETTDEKTAELRQGLIRAIEYGSNAQAAYLGAAQAMYEGSYGFFRISRDYVSPDSFEQRIVIRNIPNPDSVLYYPHCKEPDWSDAKWCFVIQPMDATEFKAKYPDAKVVNFTDDEREAAKDWLQDKIVMVAEYWEVKEIPFTLYELEDGTVTRELNGNGEYKKKRPSCDKEVWCYLTNGIEILEEQEEPEPGDQIPIPAVIGLERYVEDNGKVKRILFSLIRLGRDPQMMLAYLVSQEAEEAGLTPKTPYVGYVGQFETDSKNWDTATYQPHARLQVDAMPDSSNGQVLPLPRREPFTPNFQAYEVAKDSCRRAIMSAMGISPLPTAAQRSNEKSGIALERIRNAEQVGSFHFVDGFERALQRAGRIIDSWIPAVYDTERVEPIRKPDDSHQMVRLNTEKEYTDDKGVSHYHVVQDGKHNVTVSVGPSSESQRAAAESFIDTLAANIPVLLQLVGPERTAKILSLSIQMKQLGPKGDEIAEIISPTNTPGANVPPQMQAAMAQAQQQLQQMHAYAQGLEGQLQKLTQEKEAKIVDNEYKITLEKMKIEAQLAVAEINTKSQALSERIEMINDLWEKLHDQAHEAGLQAAGQAHEAGMQAADQVHEAGMQDAQQQHEQQLAQMQTTQAPEQPQAEPAEAE